MKFARYLEEQQQPEWSKVYIRYRPLKRLIKSVEARRRARMAYLRSQQPPNPPSAFARTFTTSASLDHRPTTQRTTADRSVSPGDPSSSHPAASGSPEQQGAQPSFHLARYLWDASSPTLSRDQPDGEKEKQRDGASSAVSPGDPQVQRTLSSADLPSAAAATGAQLTNEEDDAKQYPACPVPAPSAPVKEEKEANGTEETRRTEEHQVDHHPKVKILTPPDISKIRARSKHTHFAKHGVEGREHPQTQLDDDAPVLPPVHLPPLLHIDPQATIIPPYCSQGSEKASPQKTSPDSSESQTASARASPRDSSATCTKHIQPCPSHSQTLTDQDPGEPDSAEIPIAPDETPDGSLPSATAEETNAANQALLTLILSSFDEEERKIFAVLDTEMARMLSFYEERRDEARTRFEQIALQLQELAEHRRRYRAAKQTHHLNLNPLPGQGSNSGLEQNDLGVSSGRSSGVGGSRVGVNLVPRAQGVLRHSASLHRIGASLLRPSPGHFTPAQAAPPSEGKTSLDRGFSLSPDVQVEDPGQERRVEAMKAIPSKIPGAGVGAGEFDPERYKSARRAMKLAMLELYRQLHILQSFQFLCRVGMVKILKKASKRFGVPVSEPYLQSRVNSTSLAEDDSVTQLAQATEELYAAFYEHGDMKKARERLRSMTGGTALVPSSHHWPAFQTGVFLGVAVCATCAGLVEAMHPDARTRIPQWERLMRLYGALMIMTTFGALYGINLLVWHRCRVNAPFIFQFDLRSAIHPIQFLPLPCLTTMLLAIFFWLSFLDPFPHAIAPTTWPLVWVVVVAVLLINPLPVFHVRSREWFIRTMLRLLTGGMVPGTAWSVQFKDFFLGDEMCSLMFSLSCLWLFGCSYNTHWAEGKCDFQRTWWRAALMSLFPFLRLTQCFRRWFDSKRTDHIHMVNAGKYVMSVVQCWIYVYWRWNEAPQSGRYAAIMAVISTVNSLYSTSWDILMDWSLLQVHSKPYPLLRNTLWFSSAWYLYYVAIVTNIYIRFAWTIYFYPGSSTQVFRGYLVGLLEMLRRWQWNFLRVENEHLGNSDSYRVVRDVPLPYPTRLGGVTAATGEGDEEDEDDDRHGGGRGGGGGHSSISEYAVSLHSFASRWARGLRTGPDPDSN